MFKAFRTKIDYLRATTKYSHRKRKLLRQSILLCQIVEIRIGCAKKFQSKFVYNKKISIFLHIEKKFEYFFMDKSTRIE